MTEGIALSASLWYHQHDAALAIIGVVLVVMLL
jgi:hypothetical protein